MNYSNELNTTMTASMPDTITGPRSVVLAVDGEIDSDNAVSCASGLAAMTAARIHVVSVADLSPQFVVPPPAFGDLLMMPPSYVDEDARLASQLKRVREQLSRVSDASSDWTVSMRTGTVGTQVAEFATSVNADIVICGRGRHGLIDRVLGEEHLMRLLRVIKVPLLAVEPAFRVPAKRVVMAVDFSEHNVTSLRAAVPYIADDATIYLTHVKPDPPFGIPHPGRWIRSYEDGVRTGLRKLQDQVAFPPLASIEPIVVNGHPGVALAEFARASRSDLLVVGSQGAGFWNRLVIGAVTSYLLRAAGCSLFVVPKQ